MDEVGECSVVNEESSGHPASRPQHLDPSIVLDDGNSTATESGIVSC
jgi:hypothetical protein